MTIIHICPECERASSTARVEPLYNREVFVEIGALCDWCRYRLEEEEMMVPARAGRSESEHISFRRTA